MEKRIKNPLKIEIEYTPMGENNNSLLIITIDGKSHSRHFCEPYSNRDMNIEDVLQTLKEKLTDDLDLWEKLNGKNVHR